MKRTGLFLTLACIFAVFAVSVQPCFAAEVKTLKIGSVDSLTGWMAAGEKITNDGAALAVDWINDKGGITVKGEKYKLQLITEDAKSSPEGMMAACTKLAEKDKVKFIIGGVGGVMNIAANSVTGPAGILRIANYGTLNPDELGPEFPLSFYTNTTLQNMRPELAYLKQIHPEVKKLALTHPADQNQPYRAKYLTPIAQTLGFDVVYSGEWPGETVDFSPFVLKALASKPDALVYTDGWPYHSAAQTKAARALGFKGPILMTSPHIVSDVIQLAGPENAEGFFTVAWDLSSPEMTPIIKNELIPRAKAKLGEISQFLAWGWNTLWILTQMIESAQSIDPVVVAKHFRTMKTVETVWGTGKIGGQKTFGINCVVGPPQAIFVAKGGKPVFVKWVDTYTP